MGRGKAAGKSSKFFLIWGDRREENDLEKKTEGSKRDSRGRI